MISLETRRSHQEIVKRMEYLKALDEKAEQREKDVEAGLITFFMLIAVLGIILSATTVILKVVLNG